MELLLALQNIIRLSAAVLRGTSESVRVIQMARCCALRQLSGSMTANDVRSSMAIVVSDRVVFEEMQNYQTQVFAVPMTRARRRS
jgi:hypothetical protein